MTSRIPLLLRAAVSVSILILIMSRASLAEVAERAKSAAPAPLAVALLLVVLGYALLALRWRLLMAWLGLAVPAGLAVRAVFQGLFAGQVLPSTLGADLVRGWVAARHTGSTPRAAASVVADRLVGLFGSCLLLALALALLGWLPAPFAGLIAPAAVLASGALLLAFLLMCTGTLRRAFPVRSGMLREFARIDGVVLRAKPILAAIALALAIHAIAVVAAAATATAFGVDASLGIWLAIIPVSLIACALPVSINGWGVREAVIVALAAGHGIVAADALLVALTLGALNIVASLPGAYLLWSPAR